MLVDVLEELLLRLSVGRGLVGLEELLLFLGVELERPEAARDHVAVAGVGLEHLLVAVELSVGVLLLEDDVLGLHLLQQGRVRLPPLLHPLDGQVDHLHGVGTGAVFHVRGESDGLALAVPRDTAVVVLAEPEVAVLDQRLLVDDVAGPGVGVLGLLLHRQEPVVRAPLGNGLDEVLLQAAVEDLTHPGEGPEGEHGVQRPVGLLQVRHEEGLHLPSRLKDGLQSWVVILRLVILGGSGSDALHDLRSSQGPARALDHTRTSTGTIIPAMLRAPWGSRRRMPAATPKSLAAVA